MTRRTIAMILALAGTICWLAVAANLLPGQIGWFAAIICYLLSGAAWWLLPVGSGRDK